MKKVILISLISIGVAAIATFGFTHKTRSNTSDQSFVIFQKSFEKLQKAAEKDSIYLDLKFNSIQKMYNPLTSINNDDVEGELPQLHRGQFFTHENVVILEAKTYQLNCIHFPVSGNDYDPNIFVLFADENKKGTDTLYYFNELQKDAEGQQGTRTLFALGGITPAGEIFTLSNEENTLPKEVVEFEIKQFLGDFRTSIQKMKLN